MGSGSSVLPGGGDESGEKSLPEGAIKHENGLVKLQASMRGKFYRNKRIEQNNTTQTAEETTIGIRADNSFNLKFPINFETSAPDVSSLQFKSKGLKFLELKRKEKDETVVGGELYLEEIKEDGQDKIALKFGAYGLDCMDRGLLGVGKSSDPFLKVLATGGDGEYEYVEVHKTEIVHKELSPSWQQFEISVAKLCKGDPERLIRLEVWDYDPRGALTGARQGNGGLLSGLVPRAKPRSPRAASGVSSPSGGEAGDEEGGKQDEARVAEATVAAEAYEGPHDFIGAAETTLAGLRALAAVARPPPPLSVVIYIVGTRGDVQPFLAFAQALQKDGHRVRLATHAMYRQFVTDQGVEFYPLAGDPTKLSETMVKQGGRIIPLTAEEIRNSKENLKMIEEIIHSTWPAATAPDPDGGGEGVPGADFRADLVVANPPAYGHVHVAEALGVPLHMFFPQPWVMTRHYPHPLANLRYGAGPSAAAFFSYLAIESMMWTGTGGLINDWRDRTLGLPRLRSAAAAAALLHSVPFAHMWSPALCPKCPDWPPWVSVTGGFYLAAAGDWDAPPRELLDFLAAGPAPIFIGFGSMVINKPQKLLKMIIEAAEQNGDERIIIQSGWTKFDKALPAGPSAAFPPNVLHLGPAPHGWLMPRVGAVVHHGGAGTVAAGLRAGKPTFVCPFFGDQHFWGALMSERGVGPPPCPVRNLTASKLAHAFQTLRDPEVISNAEKMAACIAKEDGIAGGVETLYLNLETLPRNSDGKPTKDWTEHRQHLETVTDSFVNFSLRRVRII